MAGDRSVHCRIRSLIGSLFCVAMYLRVVSSFSRPASRDDARAGNFESVATAAGIRAGVGRKSRRDSGFEEEI
jgi:hypothetical protein